VVHGRLLVLFGNISVGSDRRGGPKLEIMDKQCYGVTSDPGAWVQGSAM